MLRSTLHLAIMWARTCICLGLFFSLVLYLSFHAGKLQQNCKSDSAADDDILSADDIWVFHGQLGNYNDWTNPKFKRFLRRRWIVGPSKAKAKLRRGDVSQMKQSTFVDRLLGERRNGFFVECGAAGGELISNSLFFETERQWTGLLIEPNPSFFSKLLAKRRNAYTVNTCLSTGNNISEVIFKPADYVGGIVAKMDPALLSFVNKAYNHVSDLLLTCFPLVALLDAINVKHVDYLSLDVEGPEVDILQTIPFSRVTVDVITIEYRVSDMSKINEEASEKKLQTIRSFFAKIGFFREVGILPWDVNHEKAVNERRGLDVVFQRIVD